MKLSLNTLKILSESGCDKAKDAVNEWNTLQMISPASEVVCTYSEDEFKLDLTFQYIPAYKRTVVGMPAVKL